MKWQHSVLALALASSVATSKGPGVDSQDTAAALECAAYTVEQCLTDDRCGTLDARALQEDDEGGTCVDYGDPAQAKGCLGGNVGCPAVETFAASPEDPETCWLFSSGCIPSGWTACDWVDYGECQ